MAEEAKIIRKEAKRCGPCYSNALTEHRRGRLREEARITHLALAYLRKKAYRTVESEGSKPIDAKKLVDKLGKLSYSSRTMLEQITQWIK